MPTLIDNEYHRKRYASLSPERKEIKLRQGRDNYAKLTPEQKERYKQRVREYRKHNPEKHQQDNRRANLKMNYGITPEQWGEMFSDQGYVCAICKASEPGSKIGWCTDHCHSTGKVRGILCHHCNHTIGHAKDDEQRLIDAVFYLLKRRSKPCLP